MDYNKQYFYDGFIVKILEPNPIPTSYLVEVVEDRHLIPVELSVGSQFAVTSLKLEPVCTDLFELGDNVISVLRRTFPLEGVVTGFELDTNRVIVRSKRLENYEEKRTRWAYGVSEIIQDRPGYFTFERDKYYKLNGKDEVEVRLIQIIEGEHMAVLYTVGGEYCRSVPMTCFKPTLALHYGINNVQELKIHNENQRSSRRCDRHYRLACKKCNH